jgi:hypothetical protein
MTEKIKIDELTLIAVIALIIIAFYFLFRHDEQLQADVTEICADYLEKSKDVPERLRNNPIYKKCLRKIKTKVKEPFGYGFGLYGDDQPYASGYQRSEWIQGPSPYPLLDYDNCVCD